MNKKTEYNKKWRLKNKDKTKIYNKRYREKHKEKIKELRKKYKVKYSDRYKDPKKKLKRRYYTAKSKAKSRGYVYHISFEDYKKITMKECYYCGGYNNTNGLDRVDNTKGYIINNVVSCCYECNLMKRTQTKEHFINKCRKIANNFSQRKQIMSTTEQITIRKKIYLDKNGQRHKTLQEALASNSGIDNPRVAQSTSGDEGGKGTQENI